MPGWMEEGEAISELFQQRMAMKCFYWGSEMSLSK
jgi:hypothetical protein